MKLKVMKVLGALILVIISVSVTLGLSVIYSDSLLSIRNIWIETAMSTFHHKWLATSIFSDDVINEVMSAKAETTQLADEEAYTDNEFSSDIFGLYKDKRENDKDFAGNSIYTVDAEQEIAIVNICGDNYVGKLAIIEDPLRVFIAHTAKKNIVGNNILTFLENNNAVLGVNASGFADYDGVGDGGEIMGRSLSEGTDTWGSYEDTYNTIAFDNNNRLVIGTISDWSGFRDACQFNPALIINGEKQVEGSAGWGISPRTAIGQRSDGAVIILTIDGRKPGYSIGSTMEDCANELLKYDVITAAACDGGSSSIMAYDGEIITRCSSPQQGGRYLPNAFLVKRKITD